MWATPGRMFPWARWLSAAEAYLDGADSWATSHPEKGESSNASLQDKNLSKLGTGGKFLNLIKNIYENLHDT